MGYRFNLTWFGQNQEIMPITIRYMTQFVELEILSFLMQQTQNNMVHNALLHLIQMDMGMVLIVAGITMQQPTLLGNGKLEVQ